MTRLRFRLPGGRARPLGDWLATLLPAADRGLRRRWIDERALRVDGRPADRPGRVCDGGARIEIEDGAEDLVPAAPGIHAATWFAWVDEPAGFGGRLAVDDGRALELRIRRRSRGLALLELSGPSCSGAEIVRALAGVGLPVVGDLRGGGLARASGPAISTRPDADVDPASEAEPPWPEADPPSEPLRLRISRQAVQALERGHPWLLPDRASDSAERFRPGSRLRLETRDGKPVGWAWSEGGGPIAARLAAFGDLEWRSVPSIEARVARALGRRRALLAAAGSEPVTDCVRLVHGEADGLPGLQVDRLGPLLRVLVTGRASDGFRERALAALASQLPTTPEGASWSVLEVLHLRDGRGRLELDRVRWVAGGPDALLAAGARLFGTGLWVHERGLRFAATPGWHAPRETRPGFGLFPDQRANRERLAPLAARGGRWLNLFAHTGAFSVALLAAGAEAVESVDLSRPYLEQLEANLEANVERGVEPRRHRAHRGDVRRFLEALEPDRRFAGIVLDPPTAAAAGRRFWSVRHDLEPLVRGCLARLDAGGVLLVTQNRRGESLGLDRMLERGARRAGLAIASLESAGAGSDHPSLPGFPQGEPFEGWLLTLR